MKLNIFEKMYINSPLHTLSQKRAVSFLKSLNTLRQGSHIIEIGYTLREYWRVYRPPRAF